MTIRDFRQPHTCSVIRVEEEDDDVPRLVFVCLRRFAIILCVCLVVSSYHRVV